MSGRLRRAGVLVGFWLLAWGDVSAANIVSGVLLAAVLLIAFPPRRPVDAGTRLDPWGFLKLLLYVVGQMVPSNVLVSREVLSSGSRIRTGVLAYPLAHPSDGVVSLMAHVIALTPGTMTVEATSDPAVIYVHFLLLDDLEEARRSLARLERLVAGALGGPR